MLNIGKLAADSADYYIATVASTVEAYYAGHGEAPGRWIGRAAEALGLAGLVDPPLLRQVLGGCHPDDGQPLLSKPRQVPGFDLTFRPPKSVSLLWALSDEQTSLEVRRAHDAAVAAVIDYLERHAAYTRRGRGGAEQVKVDGFVAAAFRHRTSRAGDPLLHTHVLVANLARSPDDGIWRTLDSRQLYLQAKTAGYLYQAHLRGELTRRLGVEWNRVTNGYADLVGVPRPLIEAFSRRRADIVAALRRRGETSAKAAQVATLSTRPAKPHVDQGIHARWRQRATELGFDAGHVAGLTGRAQPTVPDPEQLTGIAEELVSPAGLTAKLSTFTRRDVLRAWAERLRDGGDVARIETLADGLLDAGGDRVLPLNGPNGVVRRLTRGDVIRLRDGRVVPAAPGEIRYTTPELLALEQRLVDGAVSRLDGATAAVEPAGVDEAVARRPALSDEQAAAVRQLLTSGHGVEMVVGKAGSGKTFLLAAARDAWQAAGLHVTGCALAARAALELQSGAGIPATTIDRYLADLQRPDGALTGSGIVVVDEAAMVDTRTLARLLDLAAAAGAKVVLVGDHHQLPEINTGGAFAGLVNRLPAIELTDNRRQTQPWERRALDELRHGDVGGAVDAYGKRDRIVRADTADAARQQLVDHWWDAQAEHGNGAVMVAARRIDVYDLNRRARLRLQSAGLLIGPPLRVAGRCFQAGDRIVCLRNQRHLGVLNGMRGTVTAVETTHAALSFLPDGAATTIRLPASYLRAGRVDHGYALTAHKAQGMTCQATFVLASDAIYREWGYVALSRGRQLNQLYLVHGVDWDPVDDATHPEAYQHDHRPPLDALTARLRRSGQQALALDHIPQTETQPRRRTAPHLRALIGPPPRDPQRAAIWQEAADAIDRYRQQRGLTAEAHPLGAPPRDVEERATYRETVHRVLHARQQLRRPTPAADAQRDPHPDPGRAIA